VVAQVGRHRPDELDHNMGGAGLAYRCLNKRVTFIVVSFCSKTSFAVIMVSRTSSRAASW